MILLQEYAYAFVTGLALFERQSSSLSPPPAMPKKPLAISSPNSQHDSLLGHFHHHSQAYAMLSTPADPSQAHEALPHVMSPQPRSRPLAPEELNGKGRPRGRTKGNGGDSHVSTKHFINQVRV
jgi:hypothetical protein